MRQDAEAPGPMRGAEVIPFSTTWKCPKCTERRAHSRRHQPAEKARGESGTIRWRAPSQEYLELHLLWKHLDEVVQPGEHKGVLIEKTNSAMIVTCGPLVFRVDTSDDLNKRITMSLATE